MWFRRGRLFMVSPVHGDYRHRQAEIPSTCSNLRSRLYSSRTQDTSCVMVRIRSVHQLKLSPNAAASFNAGTSSAGALRMQCESVGPDRASSRFGWEWLPRPATVKRMQANSEKPILTNQNAQARLADLAGQGCGPTLRNGALSSRRPRPRKKRGSRKCCTGYLQGLLRTDYR